MTRLILLVLALQASACGPLITAAIVDAPNRGDEVEHKRSAQWMLQCLGVDRELRVEVGAPAASLRLWVMEPENVAPRGTLLLLHGYRASVVWIRGMGCDFARAGYRVVLVDSRGHGRSSGDYMSYGIVESRDVAQVIDELQRQDLVTGELGVWGISMGGATAIQLASRDERVKAVVAVAPYTTMRQAVPNVVRLLLPVYGWLMSEQAMEERIDAAGRRAGFDPDQADTVAAMQNVAVPTLIVHGRCDWVVPVEHGRELRASNPQHAALRELGWTGHISAHFSGAVARESVQWFDAHLSGSAADAP